MPSPSPSSKITLYRGFPDQGQFIWSPFVTKLEARLRFAGLSYENRAGSIREAPRGKIPYLAIRKKPSPSPLGVSSDDNDNDDDVHVLADSTLIIKRLIEWGVLPDLNARLAPTERAQDLGLRAFLEEKFYFYSSRERWTQNYYTMRDHVLASVPYPLRVVVGLLVYRNIAHTLHGQGTGRYTDDEIASFQREIWDCISQVLSAAKAKAAKNTTSDKNDELFWLLAGDEPTEADATLFGFIISTLVCTAYVRLSYPPTCLKIARFFV
ncbi:hypothetical protein KXW80_008325 [Aspergillus fumigatus]|nr:hypothetical protein KXW80_008325 [Aspergillus fumigatus]